MIKNAGLAKQAIDLILDGYSRIEQSIKLVEENSAAEEFEAYKRAIGRLTATILFEILEPVYAQNPKLKPAGWDD